MLWGSTPDDELLEAAADGDLTSPGGRRAAAERLLADDRARSALHRFHAMWLGYRAIPHGADLVASFDRETFESGKVYFLNIQKLGTNANLSKSGVDGRGT